MEAIITILVKDNNITITQNIDFDPIELPYGAIGYRFNGSSNSPEENLELYWSFVDEVLNYSNIPEDEYITLKNIIINDVLYGIQ